MNHSPEPWTIVPSGGTPWVSRVIRDAQDRTVASISQFTDEQNEADAKRIVTCVNACRGIPTDQLTDDKQVSPPIDLLPAPLCIYTDEKEALTHGWLFRMVDLATCKGHAAIPPNWKPADEPWPPEVKQRLDAIALLAATKD